MSTSKSGWSKQRHAYHRTHHHGRTHYFGYTLEHRGWTTTVNRGSGNAGMDCFVWKIRDPRGRHWAAGSTKKATTGRKIAEATLHACIDAERWMNK